MSTWTLADIEAKVRLITGRFSSNEMSRIELHKRINQYYQYTFPAEVKLERQHTYYEFLTTENQATYAFDNVNFTNVEPPATANNLGVTYYQDPARFDRENPYQVTTLNPWTGDGTTSAFSTTITGAPILPGSILITDETEVFEDENTTWTDADVNITGSLGGIAIVNYATGSIAVTFSTAPDNGQLIPLTYIIFAPGRPNAVLLYNNEFKFFPPPNTAYKIKLKAYKVVDPLVLATDTPVLVQWGPALAYGTAKQIFADYGEMDSYAEAKVLYQEQIDYVYSKTEQYLLSSRAAPFF